MKSAQARLRPMQTIMVDSKVLKGLGVERPGMYIGDPNDERFISWLPTVDNAIDEALAGHCDKITVMVYMDELLGRRQRRSIPVGMHSDEGRSAAEVS